MALVFGCPDVGAQIISTTAGNGANGFTGDGGPATLASLRGPFGSTFDEAGNLYFADSENYRIRKVAPNGTISTFAGSGSPYFSGDGGLATVAGINPEFLAFDPAGNLYVSDWANHRVRRISANGVITTVAGNGLGGLGIDEGPATAANVTYPTGVAMDATGSLYIADSYYGRIRKVTPAGMISRIAGTGVRGYSGDGGPALDAQLSQPYGMAIDGAGNLFVADLDNNRIRKISAAGVITTVAGTGAAGFSGDNGQAINAAILAPHDVAVDGAGNLYIVDSGNSRIRKVDRNGIITTVAGNGTRGYSGDGGLATEAQLFVPDAIAIRDGFMYISDWGNDRVRRVSLDITPPQIAPVIVGTLGGDGWYRSVVGIGWAVSDGESKLLSTSGCADSTLAAETAGTVLSCTATSAGGTASESVTIKIDRTPPQLEVSVPPVVLLNSSQQASPVATDALSGISIAVCAPLVTTTVGPKVATCTATDFAGNVSSATADYSVHYRVDWTTPTYRPYDIWSVPIARSVPLRWRLLDANGAPVNSLRSATVETTFFGCFLIPKVNLTTFGAGNTALLRFGNGVYGLDYKAPRSYQYQCYGTYIRADSGQRFLIDGFYFR
jgi:sugar lactone lactonase YvrE